MELRDKYPRSDSDADARALVHEILASNPDVADTNSLTYHHDEAELLLREGALSEADEQANAGLAMAPEAAVARNWSGLLRGRSSLNPSARNKRFSNICKSCRADLMRPQRSRLSR